MKDGRLVTRSEFGDAPLMPPMLEGKIKDPIAAKGFEYWMAIHSGPDKWLALPPERRSRSPTPIGTPSRMVDDPEFIERSKQLADDFTPIAYPDVDIWMKKLGKADPESMEYLNVMMRKQGAAGGGSQ